MINTEEKDFSKRLRSLREMKGITRKELAEMIGISESTLQRWERGITLPSLKYIKKLAIALEVSEDYLIGKSDVLLATNSIETKIKRLPEEAKEELATILDYLIAKYRKRK